MFVPNRPGHISTGDHIVKHPFLFKGVHAAKETAMLLRDQLLFRNQPLKWLQHQFFASADIVEDLLAQNEEAAVDVQIGVTHIVNLGHYAIAIWRQPCEMLPKGAR